MSNTQSSENAQIIVVEASAGSGKTYELAKRYLQLVLTQAPGSSAITLQNILAITFTNKAAWEMKERIMESLKKIALDKAGAPEQGLLEALSLDKAVAQKKCRLLMDDIIKNYNYFQVQTIDSFINSIIAGCAFMVGLSSAFKIRHDCSDYMAHSLDYLIDGASHDKKTLGLFEEFLHQYLYIENKTGWTPKKDILSLMVSMFGDFNSHCGEFRRYSAHQSEMGGRKKNILALMRRLKDNLPEGANGTFKNSLNNFLSKNTEFADIAAIPRAFLKEALPLNKNVSSTDAADRLWDGIRQEIRAAVDGEMRSRFNCYIDIFNEVFKAFRALAVKEDALFLEQLNKEAQLLFGESQISVPELYYRLALRLKHFLIDEFQDTSILQWMNLYPMVDEAIATGGSLFYVGDKKQAIFRFRGGEVRLFDSVQQRFSGYCLDPKRLAKNYRSQREIVAFNNAIFSKENLARFLESIRADDIVFSFEDAAEIISVFADSQQTHKDENQAGFVSVEHIDASDKDEEEELVKGKLISLVRELNGRFGYKDIAILTRKNDEVALVTEWLITNGIPVQSEKTLNIRENPLIKEFVSLVKFLNSPIDNLSFASFILGEIFCTSTGLRREKIEDFLFGLYRQSKAEDIAYYYREFRNRFPQVWEEFLEDFFKSVGFEPLYELCTRMYERFGVLRNFPSAFGFFMKFLELVKESEQEHPTIALFLEYFDRAPEDELYVDVARSDAVRVFTIHKAKGLGFGAVVIPFVKIDAGPGGGNGQQYCIEPREDDDETIRLLWLNKEYAKFSPDAQRIYDAEHKRAFQDELNTLYVALTRAEYELHIFIPAKAGRSDNCARQLIPGPIEAGAKTVYPRKKPKQEVLIAEITPGAYRQWPQLLHEEFIPASQVLAREKILRGEIVHYMLSCIGNLQGVCAEAAVIRDAVVKAALMYGRKAELAAYEKTLRDIISDPKMRAFFYVDGAVYREKEMVDRNGNVRRIDRLVVARDEVLIVDYKSTKDDARGYQQQIKDYAAIVRDVYPKLRVKGYLVYLDTASIEEIC